GRGGRRDHGGARRGRGDGGRRIAVALARTADADAIPEHAGNKRDEHEHHHAEAGVGAPVAESIRQARQRRVERTSEPLLAAWERSPFSPGRRRIAELRLPELAFLTA